MLIHDEFRDCVVFLGYHSPSGFAMAGTAFFVSIKLDGVDERYVYYLVTAKHVIDGIRSTSSDAKVLVRINTVAGAAEQIEIPISRWHTAPQDIEAIDVAACRYTPDSAVYDFKTIPLDAFVNDRTIRNLGIGTGDDLFFPGLFVNHVGVDRNVPIVRQGTIAAMADTIRTGIGPMRAYLVEARSIGGLSGSPVFFHAGAVRENPATDQFEMLTKSQSLLLGLMHGHWEVASTPSTEDSTLSEEVVNMGIGIVVPAEKILELLNDPAFETERSVIRDMTEQEREPGERS